MAAKASTADDVDTGAENTEGDAKPKKKLSGKKLVLFIVLPLLLLGGGGAAAYFFLFAKHGEEAAAEGEKKPETPSVFLDLPDILVNLNADGRQSRFLKVSVSIEVGSPEDLKAVETVMPRVIDQFQVYLRELRLDDLRGSAGVYRLRQEMLARVTAAAAPTPVRDVLFREILVQ
jgi:flagellar FliL protein